MPLLAKRALALSSSCRALQYQLPLASDATSTQLSRLSAAASPRLALQRSAPSRQWCRHAAAQHLRCSDSEATSDGSL